MSGQSITRLISVVLLQGLLYYELFAIQSASLRWYEWIILVVLTVGMGVSLSAEYGITDDDKSEFKNSYIFIRIINIVLLCSLLWKTCDIQSELPVPLAWGFLVVLGIGLFSVFNFLYYLVALLTTGGVFFILRHTGLEGFWRYLAISGVVAVGIGAMIGIMLVIEEKKAAERRAIEEARKRREAEEARRRAEEARRRAEEEARNRNNNDSIIGSILGGVARGITGWMFN